jgi:hypothetical protein
MIGSSTLGRTSADRAPITQAVHLLERGVVLFVDHVNQAGA